MTAYNDATTAIADRLIANWATTDIVIDNTDYIPSSSEEKFVHLHVHWASSEQAAFGATVNLFRHEGEIMVEIITPSDEGPGEGLEYADTIAGIFRAASFSGVECKAPYVTSSTRMKTTLGNFWNTTLLCPFYYDKRF